VPSPHCWSGCPPRSGWWAGALGLATLSLIAGLRYRNRAPGPYLGRAADLLDALCVISAIPLACAVLGLYGAVRGLAG
jgi:hypothetical protein